MKEKEHLGTGKLSTTGQTNARVLYRFHLRKLDPDRFKREGCRERKTGARGRKAPMSSNGSSLSEKSCPASSVQVPAQMVLMAEDNFLEARSHTRKRVPEEPACCD